MENKLDTKKLSEELLINRQNGCHQIDDETFEKVYEYCEGYKAFMDSSKTEREAVNTAIALAEKKGYVPYDAEKKYAAGDKIYLNNRGKSAIFAVIGQKGCKEGVRMVAGHIDSPRLDLKPYPLFEADEMALLKTHYYGGIKKYQWLAMPLAMHGVVVRKDGTKVEICLGEKEGEPQFCITDILPHLGKEQAQKPLGQAVEGESLNILVGSRPLGEPGEKDAIKLHVMKLLNDMYGITEEDFVSADIEFVPVYKATDIGFDRSVIGAYGHDDRVCSYAALSALLDVEGVPEKTSLAILADREEIGSMGNTGLDSEFLRYFIADLAQAEGLEPRHVLSRSRCLSADVSVAYDPNFPSVYEARNSCYLNGGVGLSKYVGSGGKSGTNEATAEFMAEIRNLFDRNHVLWQAGELGKIDAGGGGTVAMFIASLNVDVVDIGVPVLSMHAPFEMVSKLDVYMTYKACGAFYKEG